MKTDLNPYELQEGTLQQIKADAEGCLDLLEQWANQLDGKIITVLGAGAVALSLVPSLRHVALGAAGMILMAIALVAWSVIAILAIKALLPIKWHTLSPEKLLQDDWPKLDPRAYLLYRAEHLAEQYQWNLASYSRKRFLARVILIGLAIEISALTLLVIVT